MPMLKSNPRSSTGVRRYSRLFWLSLCTLCAMIALNLLHRMTNADSNNIRRREKEEYAISSLYTYGEDNLSLNNANRDSARMDIYRPQQLLDARQKQAVMVDTTQRQEVTSSQPITQSSNYVTSYIAQPETEVGLSGFIQKASIEGDFNVDRNVGQTTNRPREGILADNTALTSGVTKVRGVNSGGVEEFFDLPYYHCGPFYTLGANQINDDEETVEETKIYHEYLFLHGAAFTKEDWKTSGILQKMCSRSPQDIESHMHYSVTAVDLSVQADGVTLARVFDALAEANIISGLPIIIVSPSASGRGVLDLVSVSQRQTKLDSKESVEKGLSTSIHLSLLETTLLAWVPVACYDVSKTQDSLFDVFETSHIPVLAIHGSSDIRGQEVADRLEKLAAAKKVMLGTNHACYLDEPDRFVAALKSIFPPKNSS